MNLLSVSTRDLMKSIGFTEEENRTDKLIIDFGDFKLSAIFCCNLYGQEVVLLSGVMSTPRRIAMIQDEMPWEVESYEQGLAWITWCLDQKARDRKFEPAVSGDWLLEGRKHFDLLPWEKERIAWEAELALYNARPHCFVHRDWVRVVRRKLIEYLEILEDEELVIFEFDGEVLNIRNKCAIIAVPAEGIIWSNKYVLKAKELRTLPKRLMNEMVEFCYWNSTFKIDSCRYKDVNIIDV